MLKLAHSRAGHIPADWLERIQTAYYIGQQVWADADLLPESCARVIHGQTSVTLAALVALAGYVP